jgi:hypothetical protein
MTNKLTIGDRVITTRSDGEIGTVCGFRTWRGIDQANIVFEIGDEKWIGVDYLMLCQSTELENILDDVTQVTSSLENDCHTVETDAKTRNKRAVEDLNPDTVFFKTEASTEL